MVAQAKPSSEEQVLEYFLAGLHNDIVCPHELKELNRAMEIGRDIEEAMKEVHNYGNSQGRNSNLGSSYQGNNSIISRIETTSNNTVTIVNHRAEIVPIMP